MDLASAAPPHQIKIANQKFEVKKFLNGEIEVEAEEKVKGGFTMAKKLGNISSCQFTIVSNEVVSLSLSHTLAYPYTHAYKHAS